MTDNMKMTTLYTRNFKWVAMMVLWIIVLASAASCRRDHVEEPAPACKDDICLITKEATPLSTKLASPYMELIFSEDSVNVYLEVIERDIPLVPPAQTKGSPYYGSNIGEFRVTSFLSSDPTRPYFENLKLDSNGSAVGTGYYWPITTPETQISFWGYAKSNDNGTLSNINYYPQSLGGSFSYKLPTPEGDQSAAIEQPDLLFAISPNQVKSDEPVEMRFHHALTSIVFKVGSIPADFIIDKVEFTNLPSQGDCDYTADEDGNITFDWATSSPKDFVQEFTKKMSDSNGVVADDAVSTTEQTFMMLPGVLPDDAELLITVSFDKGDRPNTTYLIRKPLKDLLEAWTAGRQYIYKISSPEEIQVAVDDDVVENDTKKENLEIRNTGLATSYVRAILVGYWVVPGETEEDDVVVGQWRQPAINVVDDTADGIFELSADFEQNWIVGEDGFYYYKHPVPTGELTTDLFESYTVTGNPPVVDAELVLTVAAQSVLWTKIDQTPWPVKVDSDGKTLIKK